jgi:hypothetical protein
VPRRRYDVEMRVRVPRDRSIEVVGQKLATSLRVSADSRGYVKHLRLEKLSLREAAMQLLPLSLSLSPSLSVSVSLLAVWNNYNPL